MEERDDPRTFGENWRDRERKESPTIIDLDAEEDDDTKEPAAAAPAPASPPVPAPIPEPVPSRAPSTVSGPISAPQAPSTVSGPTSAQTAPQTAPAPRAPILPGVARRRAPPPPRGGAIPPATLAIVLAKFAGTWPVGGLAAERWLAALEIELSVKGIAPDHWGWCLQLALAGPPLVWWQSRRGDREEMRDWARMKAQFLRSFGAAPKRAELEEALARVQWTGGASEAALATYAAAFAMAVADFGDPPVSTDFAMRCFVDGIPRPTTAASPHRKAHRAIHKLREGGNPTWEDLWQAIRPIYLKSEDDLVVARYAGSVRTRAIERAAAARELDVDPGDEYDDQPPPPPPPYQEANPPPPYPYANPPPYPYQQYPPPPPPPPPASIPMGYPQYPTAHAAQYPLHRPEAHETAAAAARGGDPYKFCHRCKQTGHNTRNCHLSSTQARELGLKGDKKKTDHRDRREPRDNYTDSRDEPRGRDRRDEPPPYRPNPRDRDADRGAPKGRGRPTGRGRGRGRA